MKSSNIIAQSCWSAAKGIRDQAPKWHEVAYQLSDYYITHRQQGGAPRFDLPILRVQRQVIDTREVADLMPAPRSKQAINQVIQVTKLEHHQRATSTSFVRASNLIWRTS